MGNISEDTSCSIGPYFRAHAGKLAEFKKLCARFVERTKPEPGCLYYGFSFDGHVAFCREAYVNADALLAHIDNVSDLLVEAAGISDMERLEIHGPEKEIAKLRGPLRELKPHFFTVECGFKAGP